MCHNCTSGFRQIDGFLEEVLEFTRRRLEGFVDHEIMEHDFPGSLEMHLANLQVRALFTRALPRGEYQKLAFLPIS